MFQDLAETADERKCREGKRQSGADDRDTKVIGIVTGDILVYMLSKPVMKFVSELHDENQLLATLTAMTSPSSDFLNRGIAGMNH